MEIIKNISIICTSIFLEAIPFLLLGSLISAIIERYVSDELLAKIIPKNIFLGSIFGIFLGFFLPACDCAVIPVSRRLIKKRVPLNVAISFMLASPIINPVVLLSTYSAFYTTNPQMFWFRMIFGILVALVIGVVMKFIFKNKPVLKDEHFHEHCHHHEHCHSHHHEKGIKNDIKFIFEHTALDVYDIIKFLIIGALIASIIQVLLPREILTVFESNNYLSIIVLMMFAYFISLCSTTDSFVGKSLLTSFSNNSVLAYLLLGPMIDIKNTIVLLGNYNKKFVLILISLIFTVIFISCLLLGGII